MTRAQRQPRVRAAMRMNPVDSASTLPPPLDTDAEARLQNALRYTASPRGQQPGDLPTDRDFAVMVAAFRDSGGLARGDDLARQLEEHGRGDAARLARWIALRELFCFERHGSIWIPMLQFALRDLSIKPAARRVYLELGRVFDGWALALWYAQRNAWLQQRRPVELLDTDLDAVLEAARADRFIAAG